MRIALLSTCAVSVPPSSYGGTELIVGELARSLKRNGHDVTVFATGDSVPEAELRALFPAAVWPPDDMAELRHAAFSWSSICAEDPPFDVVHAHHPYGIAFSTVGSVPTVVTMHHQRTKRLVDYYRDFPDAVPVAVSRSQADAVPELGIETVVHHGLDVDCYDAGRGAGGWLAFVGRLAPEKGPDIAIDVATAVGVPLRMGGKPHWADGAFFDRAIRPRLERAARGFVRWEGEVTFEPKLEILRGARATLFPIGWDEPFGLVMIESMLVGTPVVAFARGAAPEIVDDGVTGFLVRDCDEMIDRVRRIGTIDRARCRARARERYDAMRMARDYERVYARAILQHRAPRPRAGSGVDLARAASR
jgi:glycosyltransferase involved in cell wall biosynthesis